MLKQISIKNYRNIESLDVDLPEGLRAIFVGDNGKGKSNILEAVYLSTRGQSFKPLQNLAEIIGPDEAFAKVSLTFDSATVECIVSQSSGSLTRQYKLNGKRTQLSKIRSRFPVVLFAPQTMDIADKDPGVRRQDLDEYLSMLDPIYDNLITSYNKIVKNRNALLRHLYQHPENKDQLKFWDNQGIDTGAKVIEYRQSYFNQIQDTISKYAPKIYHQLEFGIDYSPNIQTDGDIKQAMTEAWESDLDKQMVLGRTLRGPHKDDYVLKLGDQNLRYLGSRGQQRLGVLIWKLTQYQSIKPNTSHTLLLVDDLMSELDPSYQEKTGQLLTSNTDIHFLLTVIREELVPSSATDTAKIIKLGE